nr:hypothetical protein C5F59_37080 [Streptomyces sp. QL37]
MYGPYPGFLLWFVEPAVRAFGRRRVRATLVGRQRTGTEAERAGLGPHPVPLHADRYVIPLRTSHGTARTSG